MLNRFICLSGASARLRLDAGYLGQQRGQQDWSTLMARV